METTFLFHFGNPERTEDYNKKEKQEYTQATVSLHAQTGQIESCHPYNRDLIEPATQLNLIRGETL